jgi:hypothetical protein
MKNKIATFTLLLFGGLIMLFAQKKDCKVLAKGIEKSYTGKCKNGLAHGKGIAKGKNTYVGMFKKGLPNGKGTVTYANGNYFKGSFKNGQLNGKGKFVFKINGADSVRIGYWEKNKYVGKKKIPEYKVKWNRGIDRYSFMKIGESYSSAYNKVKIKFMQNGSFNTSISDIRLDGTSGNRIETPNYIGFENITFPFTCKLNYKTLNKLKTMTFDASFEFTINKPGEWDLILNN